MVLKRFLFLLTTLLVFFACTDNEAENPSKYFSGLEISADFIKLMDDSTNIAGNLDISTDAPQVYLRWNVPEGCNLDTTLSVVQTNKGKATLPIKWNKTLDSCSWGPIGTAYEGGVVVSTERESKYVRLFWVEELDTIAVLNNPINVTRANDVLPANAMIELQPDNNVVMHQQTGGGVSVVFSGVPTVRVDVTDVTAETNVDLTKVPLLMHESSDVFFKWTAAGAPNFDFVRSVRFIATSLVYVDAILNYRDPRTTAIYKFVSSAPKSGGVLEARNAKVSVVVNTNKEWSLESQLNAYPPTEDPSAFGPEDKTLEMYIKDNEDSKPREVTIYVKSQGVVKDTLTFTQLGATQSGIFEFVKTVPTEGKTIPATETGIEVTVKTDQNWYIDSNVSDRVNYEVTGEVTTVSKTYNIPANPSNENRIVTLIISAGDAATAKTVQFVQSGKGTTPENPLHFVNVLLPDRIPVTGGIYTFNFEGNYTGNLRIRSKSGNQVLYTENPYTYPGVQPKGQVPANTGHERVIIFEYDKNDGIWLPLPIETNRIQEGNGGAETGSVKPGVLTPDRDLWEYGENCSCEFTGDFTGTIILRGRVGNEELIRKSGKVNSVIYVAVPQLIGLDRVITFEYSIDNGNTWVSLGERKQVNENISFEVLQPSGKNIPASGQTYTWTIKGTYSKKVTMEVYINSTDAQNKIYGESAVPVHTFSVTIPPNTKKQTRTVFFRYKLENDEKWTILDYKYQAGSR